MSRRIRTTAAQSAAPQTVHIPRQRGKQVPQVIVVVSEEPTLTARAAAASGRWVWKHRRSWAPTGIAVIVLMACGVVHLIEPRTAWFLAPLALAPVAVWVSITRRRPATSRTTTTWRALAAAAATGVVAFVPVAIWFSPTHPAVALSWALLTLAAQLAWLIAGRLAPTYTKESR
ncbi:hypothetical protein ABT084_04285 [Streptomyces sp. NPDC002138]|uniref:hypothetical protein n=1 Tax=Streptomyces sp. NPDC002138 TaxID=3154410 RepID=UPI003317BD5E